MAADEAFVTLATTDAYCMGAAVVGQSLRRHGTTRQTVVMVSPNVSREARLALEQVFDEVLLVDVLDSTDRTHLAWLGRPELGVTFTKLHCWTFTQYSKCVFLDADTLVLCNVDELFEREELSATPDPGWPDCFNSGVFVFRPSLDTHTRLLEHARQHGSFDGGDQGLLNTFFSDWAVKDIRKHLPFVYNLSANAVYTYLPAYRQYGHNVRIVHFLGEVKPWHLRYNSQRGEDYLGQFVTLWWKEYLNHTSSLLTKTSQHSGPLRVRQETEAKAPFVEDLTHLLLSDLTLTSERPELSVKQREMGTQSEDTSSVNERGAAEWTDTQDPPVSVEGGDSGSEATDTVTDTVSNANGGPATESTATEMEEDELEHRRMWEEGLADYLGKDAFDNIQKKLDRFLD